MNTDKVDSVEKKITFAVDRITQYMPIMLLFTLWSLNKGETRGSKLKYVEENEDAFSQKLKTYLKRIIRLFKFL